MAMVRSHDLEDRKEKHSSANEHITVITSAGTDLRHDSTPRGHRLSAEGPRQVPSGLGPLGLHAMAALEPAHVPRGDTTRLRGVLLRG
jgi:hypothetical protein